MFKFFQALRRWRVVGPEQRAAERERSEQAYEAISEHVAWHNTGGRGQRMIKMIAIRRGMRSGEGARGEFQTDRFSGALAYALENNLLDEARALLPMVKVKKVWRYLAGEAGAPNPPNWKALDNLGQVIDAELARKMLQPGREHVLPLTVARVLRHEMDQKIPRPAKQEGRGNLLGRL